MWSSLQARNTASFLVIRNDKIVYEKYVSFNRHQTHYTASMVKGLVGSISLMVAMNDGIIFPDDLVMKYVPQWGSDPNKSTIKVNQLATHTSGLDDSEEGNLSHDQLTGWKGDFWKQLPVPRDPFTLSRDEDPVINIPGTTMYYSNPGYAMLAYAVTASLKGTVNQDLRSLLYNRIMTPIGIPSTEWDCGYGETFLVDGLPLVPTWGGGAYSTEAAARVGRLVLREGEWNGNQIISREVVRVATTHIPGLPGNSLFGWFGNVDGDGGQPSPSLPRDAIYATPGNGHQMLLVVPSLNLIVVRFGELLDSGDFYRAIEDYFFAPLMSTVIRPAVTTNAATSVTASGGTVNGGVNPNGVSTTAWFEWGTSPTLATFSSTTSQSMGSGTSSQPASAVLSGLSPGTPYYFRVAASNASGTVKGSILTFSTAAVAPAVTTNAATSVTTDGATLNGGVNPNGAATTTWFEWGTSPTLSTFSVTPSQSMGSGTTSQAASAVLSGLSPGTTYYFRVAASNALGTVKGSILMFGTTAVAPAVDTNTATSVTASGGTVNGGVNPNGAATTAWFEWGTSPTLSTFSVTTNQSMGSGTTSQAVSAALSGLTSGTPYYFRAAASNAGGTVKGSILSFTTSIPLLAPSVTTNAATSVTATGGTLNGGVNPNGAATTAWFEWGTSPTLLTFSVTSNQSMGSGTTSQAASAALSGLSPGTTYYFRAAASNAGGTVKGSILTFGITTVVPAVTTNAATSVTATGGTLNGGVNPNGASTTAWFEWGTSPTLATFSSTTSQSMGSGTTTIPFNASISGLESWTTYYYRAVATNSGGTQKGDVNNFPTGAYFVAVGDSITRGSHDDIPSDDTSLDGRNTGGGFEPILNNLLTAARGYPHTVVNEGVSGTSSADGVLSISSTLAKHPSAKYYLVMYGSNDAYNDNTTAAVPSGAGKRPGDPGYDGTYKDNMQKIISAIIAVGKTPYLAEVPYAIYPNFSDSFIQEYNVVIDELFVDNGIAVTPPPFYAYYLANPGKLADGLHPTGSGYQSMADLWFGALTK